ncbi:unnamed protein product [Cyprideis torosa]|uniref:Uncharacterized protein n=1 Tax=Cyprideis torosa TaxID=163714 RepID=A0A7R8ZNT0_9CRUS|nr:unnamed protein product [Cyprideis torosa]CAG0887041.1 unnamed protein product [Cyprideis torosa]
MFLYKKCTSFQGRQDGELLRIRLLIQFVLKPRSVITTTGVFSNRTNNKMVFYHGCVLTLMALIIGHSVFVASYHDYYWGPRSLVRMKRHPPVTYQYPWRYDPPGSYWTDGWGAYYSPFVGREKRSYPRYDDHHDYGYEDTALDTDRRPPPTDRDPRPVEEEDRPQKKGERHSYVKKSKSEQALSEIRYADGSWTQRTERPSRGQAKRGERHSYRKAEKIEQARSDIQYFTPEDEQPPEPRRSRSRRRKSY